jgi:Peptidase M50B-like
MPSAAPKRPHATRPPRDVGASGPSARGTLLSALVISMLLSWFIPFGRMLMYPFTLLGTWVHETGHGLAALAMGGSFASLDVFADASGLAHVTHPPGIATAVVAAGGLMAPPLAGALILIVARGPRRSRGLLAVLGLLLAVSLVCSVRSLAGWIGMPLVAGLFLAVARFGGPRECMWLAQFTGLRMAVDTVTRVDYLFTANVIVDGKPLPSDISNLSSALGGNYLLWGSLLAGCSFALVAVGAYAAWRRPWTLRKENG